METPLTIKIGPVTYRVKEVTGLHDRGQELLGQIDYSQETIELRTEQGPTAKRVTLWHEIFHGILANAGLSDHDERLIDALAYGLVSVLVDNPKLRQ